MAKRTSGAGDEDVADPKTAAELKADYEQQLAAVQKAYKDGHKYEAQLQAEVKLKLKAYAGDVEKMQTDKLIKYTAWKKAEAREQLQAEHAKAIALAAN